jgi:very-short-patch-repair endonuclease
MIPANPKHKRRRTDAEVMAFAWKRRLERRQNPSKGEVALRAILDEIPVIYEREKIVQNGDGAIYLDFYLHDYRLCIDCDGLQHEHPRHKKHDAARDAWLLLFHNIKTIRFPAQQIFKQPQEVKAKILEAINERAIPHKPGWSWAKAIREIDPDESIICKAKKSEWKWG